MGLFSKSYSPNSLLVAQSLAFLPRQIEQAWQELKSYRLPPNYQKITNLVVCGMGGSNLASEVIRSVFGAEMKLPLTLIRGYNLPGFVSRDTLVIISSYSGNTEETVSCLKQALDRKAKIFCLAGGGEVIALAKKARLPYYRFDSKFNPSGQPRYGLGSQLGALLAIFGKLKIIKVNDRLMSELLTYLDKLNQSFKNYQNNPAQELAERLYGRSIIVVAAEFLSANAHILANQINESAKNLAHPYLIPELNHHLIEGLILPGNVSRQTAVLFLISGVYSPRIYQQFVATEKVLGRQKIKSVNYFAISENKLFVALETLLVGSWLSWQLGNLNNQDPTSLPYVNYFKQELKK